MKNTRKSTDNKSLCREYYIFNYIIVVSIFSIILFLYGFFPMNFNEGNIALRKDIPKFVERTRIKLDDVYKPQIQRLVIMVIDALRWDFITGKNSIDNFPITTYLLEKNQACIYKTKVKLPTVTMPRIKAMTTGSVPNFIDVVLNLGAQAVKGDNILRQTKNHGHKIVFYGDNTWLKLYPNMFLRYEGTNSFFINDFAEVDNNVTRNVEIELHKKDWSVMILHYLGLDHIGHLAGPFSSLIRPKLIEMDNIIDTIETFVSNWNKNGESSLFLLTGDHGMKDSGSHGGASVEETTVPLIAFGRPCMNKKNQNDEIDQIDIAPTLSVLLGTPIPSTNLGTIILELMSSSSLSQKLFALYYNAVQLYVRFQKISGYQHTESYKNYQNAIKLHAAWLNTNSDPNEMVPDIISMYESAIFEMKNKLTSNLLKYDVHLMTLATVLMCHILYICMSAERPTSISYRLFLTVFVVSYVTWICLNHLFDSEIKTVPFLLKLDLHFLFVTVPMFGVLITNCYLCASRTLSIDKLKGLTNLQTLLSIGMFIHTLSLSSSSFVEEEHQTWYFYWITIIAFLTYDISKKSSKQKSLKLSALLLFLMISHRILRKLNSTGDKYAHLPDISGWLQEQDSNFGMTIILTSSLILLVWMDFVHEESNIRIITFILDGFIATFIYLRHAVTGVVFKPNFLSKSRGIMEVNCFWIFTLLYIIHSIYRLTNKIRHDKKKFIQLSLFLILKKYVIISCLLHRPYNVILLPLQLIVGTAIYNVTKNQEKFGIKLYLYLWSSRAFYFYQGNSNSLATLDLTAGYVGLESYKPIIVGIFVTINTYSSEIIGFFMYIYDHSLQHSLLTSKTMFSLCKQYIFWRLVPMVFYTIVTNLHRHHLFVWSVFSPKLLYEAMHCGVLLSVMFMLQMNFILYDRTKA